MAAVAYSIALIGRKASRTRGFLLREALAVSLSSLWAHKLRSGLTLIGIVIGITSIIAISSITTGLDLYFKEKIANLGLNVFVLNRMGLFQGNFAQWMEALRKSKVLVREDADAIRQNCPLVAQLGTHIESQKDLKYKGRDLENIKLNGHSANMITIGLVKIGQGRYFTDQEDEHREAVCFIGTSVEEKLFVGGEDPIGKEIYISGHPFTVIGVAEKQGTVFGQDQDDFADIPTETYIKMFGGKDWLHFHMRSMSQDSMQAAMDQVRMVMRARHKLPPGRDDDFGFITSSSIQDLWTQLTGTIFFVATLVVSISMVVGGIVIMNIMLASVIERTREVGLRKSLGARRRDIMMQFLIESVALACIGGIAGIALAFGLVQLITFTTPLPAVYPLWAPLLSFALCSAVGIIFGIYPARKAALMDPISALRVE